MNRAFSIYLDLTRFLAALVVFIVHAGYERFTDGLPILWRLQDFGNDAVMVFFVLSGFVIAYVADQKEKTIPDYVASRLARLYSVGLPALVLTVLLDAIGTQISPAEYDGWWFTASYPALRFIVNLFFANELWFLSIRAFSNGPYWSLGYEFWYYVLFAASFFLRGRVRIAAVAVLCLLIGPKILLLFPIWLLGVWVYHRIKSQPVRSTWGCSLFVGSMVLYALFRQLDGPERLLALTTRGLGDAFVLNQLGWSGMFASSYITGLLVALNFMGAAALAPPLGRLLLPLEKPIRYLAGFTFPLYLFHYPLLQFLATFSKRFLPGQAQGAVVLLGTLLVIWVVGAWAERQKAPLKRFWLRLILPLSRKMLPAGGHSSLKQGVNEKR